MSTGVAGRHTLRTGTRSRASVGISQRTTTAPGDREPPARSSPLLSESAYRESRVVHVESRDVDVGIVEPLSDLIFRLTVRICRVIPVEVDVSVLLERHLRVPEELCHVPVDQALDVVPPRRDTE